MPLDYQNVDEVPDQEANGERVMVEFAFYGECPTCESQKHVLEIRPLPIEASER